MGKQRRRQTPSEDSLPYLRALGDPDRLKIVEALRDGPKSVGDICKAVAAPMANVSHHLHALKDVGVVSARKRGRFVIYKLSHVGESREAGTHVFDFGCVRIEFGEGRSSPSVRATRPEDEALTFLNQMVGRVATKRTKPKPVVHRSRRQSIGKPIEITNPSFELPPTPFFDTAVTGWKKEGDPSGTGVFRNFPDDTPIPGSRFVKNADGEQLATIAARGPAGLFQTVARARFTRGSTYTLTVGVGVSSVQPPTSASDAPPPAIRIALTYTDVAGLRHEISAREATPSSLRSHRLALCKVRTPNPLPKQCIGRPIGILLTTDVSHPGHSGHFIFDAVTLTSS